MFKKTLSLSRKAKKYIENAVASETFTDLDALLLEKAQGYTLKHSKLRVSELSEKDNNTIREFANIVPYTIKAEYADSVIMSYVQKYPLATVKFALSSSKELLMIWHRYEKLYKFYNAFQTGHTEFPTNPFEEEIFKTAFVVKRDHDEMRERVNEWKTENGLKLSEDEIAEPVMEPKIEISPISVPISA